MGSFFSVRPQSPCNGIIRVDNKRQKVKPKQTPEERKARNLINIAKAQAARRKNIEARKRGELVPKKPLDNRIVSPKKPKNLDKIVREILNDDDLVDLVVKNQPDWWSRVPTKNGGYIIATMMMVKAMGGDEKAATWIRKTGWGERVSLEDQTGFFGKTDFTIQVIPARSEVLSIDAGEVLESEIRQIEDAVEVIEEILDEE